MRVNYLIRFMFIFILLLIGKITWGQWVRISDLPNSSFLDLYFVNDTIGFTIGHEFIYKTIDGGYTWDTTSLGFAGDVLYEFDFINRDTGFIVGEVSGSRAFVTYDQGETWNNITPYAFNTEIAIINSNEFLWAVTGTFGVHRYNVDLGMEYEINPGISVGDLEVFSEDTMYVGGGGFSRSFDGGENWEINETPGIIWMDFPNSRVGYSASDEYFKTTDFGESWTELEIPYYFDGCTSPEIISDSIGYFPCVYDDAFDYHGIMKTTDGGNSWIFNESIPPLFDDDAIGKIFCLSEDTCWCVTYSGQIYYTTNGGGESQPPVSILDNPGVAISISPNPVIDIFRLQFNKSIVQNEFTFLDITGQGVSFCLISKSEGQLIFDIGHLPSGMYFIKYGNYSEPIFKL